MILPLSLRSSRSVASSSSRPARLVPLLVFAATTTLLLSLFVSTHPSSSRVNMNNTKNTEENNGVSNEDQGVPLPAIVHGIDSNSNNGNIKSSSSSSIGQVLTSLGERVQKVAVNLVTATSSSTTSHGEGEGMPMIVLFGDSLTEYGEWVTGDTAPGWVTVMREAYNNKVDILGRGHSGYNTRWSLYTIPRHLQALHLRLRRSPDVAVIWLGTNDATAHGHKMHVPVSEYMKNLMTLVTHVQSFGTAVVLVTPPTMAPSFDDSLGGKRTIETTRRYVEACVSIAKRMGCTVVDVFHDMYARAKARGGGSSEEGEEEERVNEQVESLFSDGLHLSQKGNALVFQLISAGIEQAKPGLGAEQVHRVFPHWDDIDDTDPSKSLGNSVLVGDK